MANKLPVWDFSQKHATGMKVCRKGHRRDAGIERCPACDRVREVRAWRALKDDPAALAAYNADAAKRKRQRKKARSL